MTAPEGWTLDSETLYLHPSGIRIERRVYRNQEAWVLVPVDLDRKVLGFPPTDEGLRLAFKAFGRGDLTPKGSELTKDVQEARAAARREENPEELAADADDEKDEDDDE